MKKKWKSIIALALVAFMTLPLLGTTLYAEDAEEERTIEYEGQLAEAGFPLVQEPTTVEIATIQSSYYGNVPELYFTNWYEEQTGVTVEWNLIPEASTEEKISLMMADIAGLPDAMMGLDFSNADQVEYGSQDIFIPLQDYIQDIGIFTKEVYDETILNMITSPDGNIYALPGINDCYHCTYAGKVWINQEWLDNLGLDYPTTTEEFRAVLQAFKDEDANGNGDPNDEIPMLGANTGWNTSAYDFLLNSFVYNNYGNRVANDNGTLKYMAIEDAWREGIKYVAGLVEDGLIEPTSFTQDQDQARMVAGDPDEVLVGVVTGATWWSLLGADATDPLQRSRQYVGLSPLEGPEGERNALTATSGLAPGKFVITENAEDPELLFRWADGLMSDEATFVSSWGELGSGWHLPDEGALGINLKPALYRIDITDSTTSEIRTDWMPNVALANRSNDFRLGQQLPDDEELAKWDSEPRLYRETNTYYEEFASLDKAVPSLMYLPEEAEEMAFLQVQISTYANENLVNYLTGNRDINDDGDWEAYLAEFDMLGLDTLLDIMQTAYDRQYGDGE